MKNKLVFVKNLKKLPPDYKVRVYYGSEELTYHPGGKSVKKSRIDELEIRVNQLDTRMDHFEASINKRMDRLEKLIANLAKQMNARFDNVEKRLDRVESRLDNVEKRLDYNNLKKLPMGSK